jgi:hypothetical protein
MAFCVLTLYSKVSEECTTAIFRNAAGFAETYKKRVIEGLKTQIP